MLNTFDLQSRDGGAGDTGQQGATQGVAQRVTESGLQRFDYEPRTEVGDSLLLDLWTLNDQHDGSPCLLGVELNDELFLNRGVDLRTIW